MKNWKTLLEEYPQLNQSPTTCKFKNAMGFIISDDNAQILGFVNRSDNLCGFENPINITDVTDESVRVFLEKLPVIKGKTLRDNQLIQKAIDDPDLVEKVSNEDYEQLMFELEGLRIIQSRGQEEITKLRQQLLDEKQEHQRDIAQAEEEKRILQLEKEKVELTKKGEKQAFKKTDEIIAQLKNELTKKNNDIKDLNRYKNQVSQLQSQLASSQQNVQSIIDKHTAELQQATQNTGDTDAIRSAYNQCVADKDNISRQLAELQRVRNQMTQETNALLRQHESKNAELTEKLRLAEKSFENLNSRRTQSDINYQQTIIRNRQLQEQADKMKIGYNKMIHDLQAQKQANLRGSAELKRARGELAELHARGVRNANFERQVNTLQSQIRTLEQQKRDNERLISSTQSQLDSARSQLQRSSDNVTEINRLQNAAQQSRGLEIQLRNQIKELETANRQGSQQLQRQNTQISQLRGQLQSTSNQSSEIARLQNENKQLQGQSSEIARLQNENSQLQSSVQSANSELATLRNEARLVSTEVQNLRRSNQQGSRAFSGMRDRYRAIEAEREQLRRQLAQLQSGAQNRIEISDERVRELENRLEIVDNERQQLMAAQGEAEQLRSRLGALESERDQLRSQLTAATESENAESGIVEQLNQQIKDLEEQKRTLKRELDKTELRAKICEQIHTECIEKIKREKGMILERIGNLRNQLYDYMKNCNGTNDEKLEYFKTAYNRTQQVNAELTQKLAELQATAEKSTGNKDQQISEIQNALDAAKSELDREKSIRLAYEAFMEQCRDRIVKEREQITAAILAYRDQWNAWLQRQMERSQGMSAREFTQQRRQLVSQYDAVVDELQKLRNSYASDRELLRATENTRRELQEQLTEQIKLLNQREEELATLKRENEAREAEKNSSGELINQQQSEIEGLRNQIAGLIRKNEQTVVEVVPDEDCSGLLVNLSNLNNIFSRKNLIIQRLEYIMQNSESFLSLADNVRAQILADFNAVKGEIKKYEQFLQMDRWTRDPNFTRLKNGQPAEKTYCLAIGNLLNDWYANEPAYREQDRRLMNLYEDITGAVRVYVRIKPGSEKNVTNNGGFVNVQCGGAGSGRFGQFTSVFDETYTTLDVFTGIKQTPSGGVSDPLSISHLTDLGPGIHSVFKQVESGYSVVVFGYGISGSGKSFGLIGNAVSPGLIHYALANLEDVKSIQLKHVFEQYAGLVKVNAGTLNGKIHNLVGTVPQMRDCSVNEDFYLPIDKNNVNPNDINTLNNALDTYRQNKGRIKETPNNPVSSRSHLYIVFKVVFGSGLVGHISFVDTAGRESPVEMFKMYIKPKYSAADGREFDTTLATVMSDTTKPEDIETKFRHSGVTLSGKHILDLLREGFYINETLNHLVWYLNDKAGFKSEIVRQAGGVDKYDPNKFYVKPDGECNSYNQGTNALTVPIMKYLDSLSKQSGSSNSADWMPTKYVMMVHVRQEEQYCDGTIETLKFADRIKSN